MNKTRRMLENWIYGLLGYEEQTYMVSRNLVKDLLDNGRTGFRSEFLDYPNNDVYQLELTVKKVDKTVKASVPIVVNVDADMVLDKIKEEMKKAIENEYAHCYCKYESKN